MLLVIAQHVEQAAKYTAGHHRMLGFQQLHGLMDHLLASLEIDLRPGLVQLREGEVLLHHWFEQRTQAVLNIINTMSYSTLNKAMVDNQIVFPDHGPYQRAYHTVRQADLLCSYKVKRCYQYQKHIAPEMPESEVWVRVNNLFQSRVFKYVTNGWLNMPKAQALVPNLIKEAEKDLTYHFSY